MHRDHAESDLRLEIVARRKVATDVLALELRDADGGALPSWSPGAHIDLDLEPGLTRQYSLCGDPRDEVTWRVGVLLEPHGRGGSQYIHEKLHEGCFVDARGPRNHFVLEPASSYVFVAGGIGITPIIPMIAAAVARGAEWELHYGGRTLDSMAFKDELLQFEGTQTRIHIRPQDIFGLLDLPAIVGKPRADTLIYCCGPEPLLHAIEETCSDWPSGSLHVERFAPVEQGPPVRQDAFEVVLATTGITVSVPPDRTIMEVVEEAGVEVNFSCSEGTCGTCETPVIDGEIDHRDSILAPEERAANDVMFICVSRAACPRITIDL